MLGNRQLTISNPVMLARQTSFTILRTSKFCARLTTRRSGTRTNSGMGVRNGNSKHPMRDAGTILANNYRPEPRQSRERLMMRFRLWRSIIWFSRLVTAEIDNPQ